MWWNKLSTAQPPQQTVEQYLAQLQNEIVLMHNKSQEVAVGAFNKVVQQLQQAMQIIKQKDDEIKRLEGLCDTNKIDHKSKAPKEKK